MLTYLKAIDTHGKAFRGAASPPSMLQIVFKLQASRKPRSDALAYRHICRLKRTSVLELRPERYYSALAGARRLWRRAQRIDDLGVITNIAALQRHHRNDMTTQTR